MSTFITLADTWIETASIESVTAFVKPNYHAANLHTVIITTKSGQKYTGDMFESQVMELLEKITGAKR